MTPEPLNWVTVGWPMLAAACLTLGLIHLGVWLRFPRRLAHLMFAGTAITVAFMSGIELSIMRSTSPAEALVHLRAMHVPVFATSLLILGYAHFQFGPLRRWLVWPVVAIRAFILALNFALPNGVNFAAVTGLRTLELPGGVLVAVVQGVPRLWNLLAIVGWLLFVIAVADAGRSAWRRSPPAERPRVARLATSLAAFLLLAPMHTQMVHFGLVRSPYFIAPIFSLVVLAIAFDLTEEIVRGSQLAEELRVSESRLRESESDRELAIDAGGLVVWTLDVSTRLVRATARFSALFGLEEAPVHRFEDVLARVHPADRENARYKVERALTAPEPVALEFRVQAAHAAWRWVRCHGRLGPESGQSLRLHGICIDVSELRLAEERFRKIVEATPGALLIADADGRIQFGNQRAIELFGYSSGELTGLRIDDLVPEGYRERHGRHRAGFMKRPQTRPMADGRNLVAIRKDGSEFPAEIALGSIPSGDGDLAMALVTDVTARRAQELAAARQRSELTHLSRVAVLGELSASLAHELNQPLAAILSNAEAAQRYLDREPVDLDQIRDIVADIVADDKRAGAVIRRLRAMLRKEELPRTPLALNDVLRGVLEIMHSDLVNRAVEVELALDARLPEIEGDSVQLQQVLLNLIVNACDAMAAKPRPRKLGVRTSFDGDEVRLEVADQGHGIPEPDLHRIFEPFVTTKPLGTGLGLSVCRTIVASHRGRIWARNNTSGGATVSVALPAAGSTRI